MKEFTDAYGDTIAIDSGNAFRKGPRVYIAITENEGTNREKEGTDRKKEAEVSLTRAQAFAVIDAILEALKQE